MLGNVRTSIHASNTLRKGCMAVSNRDSPQDATRLYAWLERPVRQIADLQKLGMPE
jgi:hypothetical protein